jgi:cytidylate kinase
VSSRATEGGSEEVSKRREPVIVVSGPPGSGKSTYAKRLAEDLGLRYFTTGEIFRAIAKELGKSLVEMSRIAESNPRIDLEIDRRTLEEATRGGVVIDSHLAGWVLAGIADFSVYVKAPLSVRAERIARREEKDVEMIYLETAEREFSQWLRFSEYYGFDTRDLSHFDLVIDTSLLDVDEVYEIIKIAALRILRKRGFKF